MSTMFTDVNEKTSEIAAQVGRTPQNWNSSVFSMIQNLSESVVVPIAGIIITLVLCYELISMLTERNNLHDVDTWMFFKYFVKAWVAIYLVSNTFTITMAVFDVGQSVVNSASGIINGETAIDVSSLSMQMQAAMATMEIGELVVLALETFLVSFCMKIMSVVITVIVYAEKTESKIAELEEYLRNVRAAQKKEEDNEIVRAIRSTKLGGRDLLALLENIQAGNVTFQTTVNHENKTSEEAEMEDVIAKDA